jgi:hypothetical protein
MSIVEDIVRSYDVPGLMWGSERASPLLVTLTSPIGRHNSPTCFCTHCSTNAEARGVSVPRAREGYRRLWELCEAARQPEYQPPADGQFVAVWRLLLEFPEILAWERLWRETRQGFRGALYGTAKAIKPEIQVGWHLWHLNSFSPFFRALHEYEEIARYSDFIKPVVYDNPAGVRFKRHLEALQQTLFRGTPADILCEFMYAQLQVAEGPLETLPAEGWSADYVYRETRRAVVGAEGRWKVYPGIGINIPAGPGNKQSEPADVRTAIAAAARAGANGVILSRQYCEMFMANLAAAGEAISQWPDIRV